MKKLLYLLLATVVLASCSTAPKAPHFNITGKISGADSVTFILQKRVDGKIVKVDSAMVLKGQFVIKGGSVEFPERVSLMVKGKRSGMSLYLENSDIVITGNIDSLSFPDKIKITGSKTQDEYTAYQKALKPISDKNNALYEEYNVAKKANDKAKMAEIEKKSDAIYAEQTAFTKEYVKTHPASYLTPTLLQSLSYELDFPEIESFINGLDTSVAKVPVIKDLKVRVAVMKTVAIGQKAPDFTLNDVNDKPVALSSKFGKSKLLLVDFWASWCGPCRAENPNVVKVFKEFNKKGLDIFSVSLDQEGAKDKWLQAIKDDKLTWTHVSDLKYWSCAAAKLYAVNSIPANFLLDDKGTIIAKNLRGDELYNKVKELLTPAAPAKKK
jgi:peroxiredoxin